MVGGMSRIVRLRGLGLVVSLLGFATACRLQTEQAPVVAEARAPDFGLLAHDGRTVTLEELVSRGPAIVVFYRGHW